ncbi:hypothetical protein [Nocardioides albus]|uniref:Uncharacterized protein n=1 Tax=Nocardioides albus TaxID=1841 RepID=A0A7W5F6U8_9ACTN|nr:hypothetical protein [Nocardioides albus]MBB3087533.1 hypothetical protein [Nocardioides albus]GGU09673.1 hypothetical protein GCM10007979_04560 [Nocardioides albus]
MAKNRKKADHPRRPRIERREVTTRAEDMPLMKEFKRALYADHPLDLLALVSSVMELATVPPHPFEDKPQGPGLAELVESFLGTDLAPSTAALHVIAALTDDDELAGRIREALATRTQPMPGWLRDLAAAKVDRVVEMKDAALLDGENYYIGVELADGSAFTFVAYVDNNLGRVLKDGFVVPEALDETVLMVSAHPERDSDLTFGHVDPAWARAYVERAVDVGAMTFPPLTSEAWPQARPLLRWALRLLPEGGVLPEQKPMSEAAKEALIEEFVASPEGKAYAADPEARGLVGPLIWLGTEYGNGDPLRWSPVRAEMLLADYFPRKVRAPLEEMVLLPDVLTAWVRFGHRLRGIRRDRTEETVRAIAAWTPTYLSRIPQGGGYGFGPGQLADLVGGREPLDALNADPLPGDEPFDWTGVREDIRPKIEEILALCDASAERDLDLEHRTANRRLLHRLAVADPDYFLGRAAARTSAAAVAWMIAHANDSVGPYTHVTVGELLEPFGVKSASQRASRFRKMLGLPEHFPADGAMVLGTADLLVSGRRAEIIADRDGIDPLDLLLDELADLGDLDEDEDLED